MRAVESGTARTRLNLESPERFVALRRELGVSAFGLNLILLQPGQRGRIHRHEHQEEVYLVLEGTLSLLIEAREHTLGPGELIRVAPEVRRQLVNAGRDRLALLAIGGAGEHAGRDGTAFASWADQTGAAPQDIPLPPDIQTAGG
jgi:uncharacterized cupin superfamily protein